MARYSLETIILILVVLWLLGAFVAPFGGDLIHLLLVIILVVVILRLVRGGRILDLRRRNRCCRAVEGEPHGERSD